jgi:hypothetical protein
MADLACFRNDGHAGDHAYPTPETKPQPFTEDPHATAPLGSPERLAYDFALDVGSAYPKTYPDVLALEADLLRFLRAALAAAPTPAIDRERLARAVFESERPGDWPTWEDYIGAFGTPGIAPWTRKADRILAALSPAPREETTYIRTCLPTPPRTQRRTRAMGKKATDQQEYTIDWAGHYSMETIDRAWGAYHRVIRESPERAGIEARAGVRPMPSVEVGDRIIVEGTVYVVTRDPDANRLYSIPFLSPVGEVFDMAPDEAEPTSDMEGDDD